MCFCLFVFCNSALYVGLLRLSVAFIQTSLQVATQLLGTELTLVATSGRVAIYYFLQWLCYLKEALSVLMLCAPSNRRRPRSYRRKMADFEYFRDLSVNALKKMG